MKRKDLLKLTVGVSLVAVIAVAIPLISGCAAPAPTPTPTPEPTPEPTPAPEPAAEEPIYHLRFQTLAGAAELPLVHGPMIDHLEKMSRGRIQIDAYSSYELVPDEELLPAVKAGTVDLAGYGAIANPSLTPCGYVEHCLVFGVDTCIEAEVLWTHWGLKEMIREDYEDIYGGVHLVGQIHCDSANCLASVKPVYKYEDLNGLKLASIPDFAGPYVKAGATIVSLPPDEILLAGQTGIVDAVSYGCAGCMGVFGFQDVFPYMLTDSTVNCCTLLMIINEDVWNSMPPDLQEMLVVATEWNGFWNCPRQYEGERALRSEWKEVNALSVEDHAKLLATRDEIWDDLAAINDRTAKVIDIYRRFNDSMEALKFHRPI